MKRFFGKSRGAVTVMVTLLLIPAVLVTGTGVDVARIYTSKAVLQDANQLALNSVLADYDALLQDLYGLYAVSQSDETLGKMVNEYVEKTVFATDSEVTGSGVLKLFYGTKPESTLTAGTGQNLGDTDQLRRQIEEYAKLRVPVILVKELLDRLSDFEKVKSDAAVIDKKTEVENHIESIDKIYRAIYTAINNVSGFKEGEVKALDELNKGLGYIREQFEEMKKVRDNFDKIVDKAETLSSDLDMLQDHYQDIAVNVGAIMLGPGFKADWEVDPDDPDHGSFTTIAEAYSMNGCMLNGSDMAESYGKLAEALNTLCQQADSEKESLKKAIEDLEEELGKGTCSDTLNDGLTKPAEGNSKSLLQQYKDLVRYDVGRLGTEYMGSGGNQLKSFKELMDGLLDGSVPIYMAGSAQTGEAFNHNFLSSSSQILSAFDLNYNSGISSGPDRLKRALITWPLPILNPEAGYKNFQETSGDHQDFYNILKEMYGSDYNGSEKEKKEKEDSTKGSILAVFNTMKDMFSEIYPDPEGAHKYVSASGTSKAPSGSDFCGADSDWGDTDKVKKSLQSSLKTDIISKMGDLAGSAADKLLLLGYATEMFSCYSTGRGTDTSPVSMAGIPLSVDVNYYYQSELEYIYNGNLADAIDNVNSLGSMILLTRFVLNYIVSFTISSVNDIVSNVESALAFLGPVAIAIGELARLGLALGESLTDLSRLRSGHKVAVIKDNRTWRFSLTGLANMTADAVKDAARNQVEGSSTGDSSALDDENGIYYFDYVRIFLLFVNGDDMAQRVGKLIALNMTNKTQGIGAKGTREEREQAMAAAELYDMSKARTGFTLTTTVDVSMLFLSMPFAQKGINSVIPPKSLKMQATDYRGY